jgi:hypothetical protein
MADEPLRARIPTLRTIRASIISIRVKPRERGEREEHGERGEREEFGNASMGTDRLLAKGVGSVLDRPIEPVQELSHTIPPRVHLLPVLDR